jgi:hypothetical protein
LRTLEVIAGWRLHRAGNVGLEAGAGGGEILLVEQLIIPLAGRELGLRIDRAVDQRDDVARREAARNVGHAEVGDPVAAVRVVAGEAPDHRAAPVVTDEHRLLAAEAVQQLDHVGRALGERIGLVAVVDAGASVAAHVRRDGAEAHAAERRQLMAPADRQLRPAMDKDHQRPVLGPAGEIEAGVPRRLGDVLGDGEGHRRGS